MRITYNSPVILSFTLLCAAIMIIDISMSGSLINALAVGNSVDWSNPKSISTLFTHAIAHANVAHLMGNMTFVLLLGPTVEEKYGSRNTVLMIIVTAVITGILNISFFDTGLIGASGIVFMLILLSSFTNHSDGDIPLTFVLVALLFLGKEIWTSLSEDRISQFAHIIGGICGSVFGFSGILHRKSANSSF